eukprot:CAMPEP_0201283736 /NCGR_PEP_ID=MMETSP1317-20130820/45117_1 /ASSEMBLY_ACC=CAM_ASM_000770 /TAXON_ID=187299 /ORGANISM="Undescribed Undescribed, Strain Undescribed" /LENGTH=316 /DNA_ID=CAMNT_0047601161 /DNA_START=54 /DNA_END=1004 /DNA_ORIENTATION=+
MVKTALENGASGVLVPTGCSEKIKKLGKIKTISADGDFILGKDVVFHDVKSKEDEDDIIKISKNKKVILDCSDWKIIPIENLIAKNSDIIVKVKNIDDAKTTSGILEKGVDHILYEPSGLRDLKKALSILIDKEEIISLSEASIIEVRPLGMGDRVCVDTCTLMGIGEGMLVGTSSSTLFLIHAESVKNPYVSPRPFRVNAGAVYAYTRVLRNKTKYLSELMSGDSIQLVDYAGKVSSAIVGRVKIEKRPLMLVKAECENMQIGTIVQNAETIRFTNLKGEPVSVVELKKGKRVLVAIEAGGRHFGHKIEETITEK